MKIDSINPITTNLHPKTTSKVESDGKFKEILNSKSKSKADNSINVNSLQFYYIESTEDKPEQEQKEKALKYAKDLLQELKKIKKTILSGNINSLNLADLQNFLTQSKSIQTTDSNLNSIINEIEVRLAVEMAKINN